MTRKALEKFNPDKLRFGTARIFEVRNKKTGFGEFHYFYKSKDGILFQTVCKKGLMEATERRKKWSDTLEVVSFKSKDHLSYSDTYQTLCGGTQPKSFAVEWNGKPDDICKKCITKLIKICNEIQLKKLKKRKLST